MYIPPFQFFCSQHDDLPLTQKKLKFIILKGRDREGRCRGFFGGGGVWKIEKGGWDWENRVLGNEKEKCCIFVWIQTSFLLFFIFLFFISNSNPFPPSSLPLIRIFIFRYDTYTSPPAIQNSPPFSNLKPHHTNSFHKKKSSSHRKTTNRSWLIMLKNDEKKMRNICYAAKGEWEKREERDLRKKMR